MNRKIIELANTDWRHAPANGGVDPIMALETGKVLYFPAMPFTLNDVEKAFLTSTILAPKKRNISLDANGKLNGVLLDHEARYQLAAMLARFRGCASELIASLLPSYSAWLRLAPTSYRPMQVEGRAQSWRADDRRLHVDAFPSRPNNGERILRVFANINPQGLPRVWRIGEPFEEVARRFLPRLKVFSPWQARVMHALHITKTRRSEYDHLMLQMHDAMKADLDYQSKADQISMAFPAGAVWVCFSDQTSHAVMSGQFMMEQTFHLPVERQYYPEVHPLAILRRLTGRILT